MASRRGSGPPMVAFVYPNPRAELAAQVAAGDAPDSTLLGQNHLAELGIDARLHDPALTSRRRGRLRWNLREVTLPWELGDADVACTPLAGLFPSFEEVRLPPGTRARAVSSGELRELYAGAACVVVPQRRQEYPYGSEGGGLTSLLETLAMARPLVATDRPILHEYVTREKTALVVPPEDPEALAAAIGRVLGDAELARHLGEAGRARVEAELTTRRFAERLAPILRAAAAH